ncbi:MAG: PEP-CTERM sorting domain-containing protein [Pseudomonadota bacterium]
MRNLILNTVCACLTVVPISANASIIDNFTYTTDTDSGLDWLDVTASLNMSHNAVEEEFVSGGIFEGWRYATGNEFNTFISNYLSLDTPIPNYSYGRVEVDGPALDELIVMLGDTYNASILANQGVENHVWVGSEDGLDYGYTHGLIVDRSSDVIFTAYYSAIIVDNVEESTDLDFFIAHNSFTRDRYTLNGGGSYLVRASIVPVPSAVWLFGSGLIGLIGLAKRKQS